MMKALALTIAIGAASVLVAADARALPLAPAQPAAATESGITLVRDGCGRGMRYSNRRGGCVPQYDRGPRYYDRRPSNDAAAAAAAAAGVLGVITRDNRDRRYDRRRGDQRY